MFGPAPQSVPRDAPARPSNSPTEPETPGTAPPSERSRLRRSAIVGVGVGGALFVAVTIFTLVERRMYGGRVLPGVEIDGVSASGDREVNVYDAVARLGVALARS